MNKSKSIRLNNESSLLLSPPHRHHHANRSATTPRCSLRRRPLPLLSTPVVRTTKRTALGSLASPASSSTTKRPPRRLRRRFRPSTLATSGGDRFIPNRSRVDTSRVRRALTAALFDNEESACCHSHQKTFDDDVEEESSSSAEYKRRLRRVLFEDTSTAGASLLGLVAGNASADAVSTLKKKTTRHHHPLDQDILRMNHNNGGAVEEEDYNHRHIRHGTRRKIDLTRDFTLDMTGVDSRDDLHVMSVGPRIAVAIEDSVHFDEWGVHSGGSGDHGDHGDHDASIYLPPLELEHMGTVSAVQWRCKGDAGASSNSSSNKYLLAVGAEDSVEVYNVDRGNDTNSRWAQLTDHMDTVTALEWIHDESGLGSDYELLASSSVGIRRYDLRLAMPEVFTYNTDLSLPHSTADASAAKMQLQPQNGNLLAAAIPQKGLVALWDLRYSRVPFQTLNHDNVKGLEFCPHHRNTLASGGGGQDGIRLWNVQAGTLRTSVASTSTNNKRRPVTSLTWSPSPRRYELLAGFGRTLGVWSFSSSFTNSQRLGHWTQPNVGPVIAVERMNNNDGRVLSLHGSGISSSNESRDEESSLSGEVGREMMICWKPFEAMTTMTTTSSTRLSSMGGGAAAAAAGRATLDCSPVIRNGKGIGINQTWTRGGLAQY